VKLYPQRLQLIKHGSWLGVVVSWAGDASVFVERDLIEVITLVYLIPSQALLQNKNSSLIFIVGFSTMESSTTLWIFYSTNGSGARQA